MPVSVIFFPEKRRSPKWVSGVLFCAVLTVVLAGMLLTLREIDHRQDLSVIRMEQFRVLPPGEYLKPILLGYQNIAADVLWLRMIQVLGERKVSAQDYEWLYHALDVITTLDPQYTYAYQIGGIVLAELAHRVDLSDQILQKGVAQSDLLVPAVLSWVQSFFPFAGLPGRGRVYGSRLAAARAPGICSALGRPALRAGRKS